VLLPNFCLDMAAYKIIDSENNNNNKTENADTVVKESFQKGTVALGRCTQ